MADVGNIHATGVVLAERAVLILGASGAGKTSLGLSLVAHARRSGLFARFVGDDQLLVSAQGGRLILCAPPAIAGQAEVRGLGPRAIAHEARAVADLAVRLVDAAVAPRFSEARTETFAGVSLPCLALPAGDRQGALLAVSASLGLPPFAPSA